MIQIDLGILGVVVSVCLSFGAMLLANKLTGFGASYEGLAVVALASVLLSMIPSYGWLISLFVTFLMLRAQSKNGVILMMIVSWIMTFVILIGLTKLF